MNSALKQLLIAIMISVALTGCASQPTVSPSYYLLSSTDLSAQALNIKPFKLALGPIDVPLHLDREGIVKHDDQNRLSYAENHRWAEPFGNNLGKILLSDIAQMLPKQQLIKFPYRQANQPDFQLALSIDKFGYFDQGQVVLKARSTLTSQSGTMIDTKTFHLHQSHIDHDYPMIVKAMSKLLSELAIQLATQVNLHLNNDDN